MNLFQNLSSKKLIAGLALLIVVAAVPLTVYIAQKQQEIRQRASGEETSLYFTQSDCSASPVSQVSLIVGQQSTLSFCLDAGTNPISGFDIIVQNVGTAQNFVSMNSLNEGEGAQRFPSEVFKRMENGTVHFAKVTTDTSNLISGKLRLAMATFTPTTVATSGNITVSEAIVTSAASPTALSVSKPTLTYSIGSSRGGPTITPSPGSPSASITGPTTGRVGEQLTYATTAQGSSLTWVRLYRARTNSDVTQASSWTLVGGNEACGGSSSCTATVPFTPQEEGSYYMAVNARQGDAVGSVKGCSGNPAVKDGRVTGFSVCGPNDLITLAVGVTSTLTPTTTPVPGAVRFTFTLALDGIGRSGGVNKNLRPRTNPSPITVELFDSDNEPAGTASGRITFNSGTNFFRGTVDMGTLTAGNYTIRVTSPRYLTKLIPGFQTITSGRTTPYVLPTVRLIAGDVNNDNKLDILDYNIIVDCNEDKRNSASCQKHGASNIANADLDDDGSITDADYSLFLDNLSIKEGD